METLGERITDGQAADLALYLPRDVRRPLADVAEDAREVGRDEFLERVATRANVEKREAADLVRAAFDAVRESTGREGLENLRTQLPREFDDLFDR